MIISLTDHAIVGKETKINEVYSYDTVNISGEEYKIIKKSDVSIKLNCEEKDKVKLVLFFDFGAMANCDRCLEDVIVDLNIDYEEEFMLSSESVDTDEIINKEIMLNWPMKILCSEDCKGLCLKCGLNLNKEQCNCDTFVPDPRMAAIKDIFESER